MPVMSLGIRSGVNWMRLKSSESDCASECTISVLASPGTPSRMQWPRAKTAIRSCSTTSSWPTICRAICSRIWSWAWSQLFQFGEIDVVGRCVLQDRVPRLLALEDRKILERKLQDDGGDRRCRRPGRCRRRSTSRPAPCMASNWSRVGGEVVVPVLVARHVEALRRRRGGSRRRGRPPCSSPRWRGTGPRRTSGSRWRWCCRTGRRCRAWRRRPPRSAAGARRRSASEYWIPPSGVRHFSRYLTASSITALRDQEPRVVRRPQGLHLGDRHRAFVAGAGDVGPAPCSALALAGQRDRLADRRACTCWRSDSLVIMP